MATATIKGFIHANLSNVGHNEFVFFTSEDMTSYGYAKVMPHSFDIEIPDDFNVVAWKVGALETQKEKLREEFNRRVAQINEEISKLQCLEFDPQVTA